MVRRYLFALVPAVALFLACGDDDDGATPVTPTSDGGAGGSTSSGQTTSGAPEEGGASVSECAKVASAVCGYGARCLPGFLEATTCDARATALCDYQHTLNGYSTTPTPQSCLDAYNTAACTGAQTPAALTTGECTIKGTLAVAAGCDVDEQCATGNCFGKTTKTCGQCADFAAAGADCTNAKCTPGLQCVSTKVAGERKCRALDALGAECFIGSCAFPNKCVGGTCKAPLADGADCTHPATDESPCEKSCLTDTKKCGPSPNVFVKLGEKCEGVSLICPANTSCHGPKDNQKCLLDALEGEACSDTDGPECAQNFACTAGKCAPHDKCK